MINKLLRARFGSSLVPGYQPLLLPGRFSGKGGYGRHGRFLSSLLMVAVLGIGGVGCIGSAGAQTYTYTVNSSTSSSVTLPAGGGTAHVASGVSVTPASGNALIGQVGDIWSITNDGSISTTGAAVYLQGPSGTINNNSSLSGGNYTILNQGSAGLISLTVNNAAGATIQAPSGYPVGIFNGDALNIHNDGTITGFGGVQISLNQSTAGNAQITNSNMIKATGSTGTALNLTSGSNPLNAVATIDNLAGGQIVGGASGCALNTLHVTTTFNNQAGATVQGGGGLCSSDLFSFILADNSGSILGSVYPGFSVYGGGEVTNESGGLIRGISGVSFVRSINYTDNRVTNAGDIIGTGTALVLGNGQNAGAGTGIYISGTDLGYPVTIDNQAGGTISGGVYGIYSGNGADDGPVNIRNAGTITAGTSGQAIRFSQSLTRVFNNNLTLDTGSVLNGQVIGGISSGIDALILTGTGSEDGSKFSNFEDLRVNVSSGGGPASFWTLNNTGNFSRMATLLNGTLRITGALNTLTVNISGFGTLAGSGAINANVVNNGTVAPGAGSSAGSFVTMPVKGNYSGNGTLKLNIQLGDSASPGDRLMINGTVSGTNVLSVSNIGGSGAPTTGFGILVAKNVGGNMPDNWLTLAAPLQVGNYLYSLVMIDNLAIEGGGSWYLQSVFNPVTPIDVLPPVLPDGSVGDAYSQVLSAEHGTGPYTFSVTAGALPSPFTLTPAGLLSGTPTLPSVTTFTVTATDSTGRTGYRVYTLRIDLHQSSAPPFDPNQTHAEVENTRGDTQTVTGVFVPKPGDQGKPGTVFVFAYLPRTVTFAPDTFWIFDSGRNWHLFDGDCRVTPAYFTGDLQILQQIPIVSEPTDLSIFRGAELYIGYGLGGFAQPSGSACNDMLARQNWVKVYTVPIVNR